MSVLTESEGLEVFCPIHGHGINHKVNCFGWSKYFMHFIVSVDLYPGTGRNPHSCCTLIETVVVSVTSLSVHSCFWSGTTCR